MDLRLAITAALTGVWLLWATVTGEFEPLFAGLAEIVMALYQPVLLVFGAIFRGAA